MRSSVPLAFATILTVILLGCGGASVDRDGLRFALHDLNGDTVSLSDERFRGKVVLLDLWGSWCPPCLAQIPHLVAWHERYGSQGLEIVGVNFEMLVSGTEEEHRGRMAEFAYAKGIRYTVLLGGDTSQVEAALPMLRNFEGFPTSIFIGRNGTVRRVKSGFFESEAAAYQSMIEKLLAEGEPGLAAN